ncbi:hypothetical protein IVB12_15340 [Bradyrhizobium sp. 179]|uniref:hypothetical protein n=1 Tax=Bradyrhizobium sp. 179 TaxID=2782648 RepID=UPI001FF845DE|nr:hypothetical protein [Bradyrhizobium sp. 179]MCK1543289.1 hypothetical protein [Bradyrhizobium sp. 179]
MGEYSPDFIRGLNAGRKEGLRELRKELAGIIIEEHFALVGRSGSVFLYQALDDDFSVNSVEINVAGFEATGKKPPKRITVTIKKEK